MPRIFKHLIERCLHFFPDGVTVGFDNHTTPYCRMFCQVGFYNQIIKPLRIILVFTNDPFTHNVY